MEIKIDVKFIGKTKIAYKKKWVVSNFWYTAVTANMYRKYTETTLWPVDDVTEGSTHGCCLEK